MSVVSLWTRLQEELLPIFARYRSRIVELPVEVKTDRTLLTEADVEVQKLIIEAIRSTEPDAVIIAEEDQRTGVRRDVREADGRAWVIDPIDGTAQFVRGEQTEFCSVVCLLEAWQPTAAFVLIPELGTGRTALTVTADALTGTILLDGRPAPRPAGPVAGPAAAPPRWLSATRSAGIPARPFDSAAEQAGYRLKTRTTS